MEIKKDILKQSLQRISLKYSFQLSYGKKFYRRSPKIWEKGRHFRIYVPYSAFEVAGFVSTVPVKGGVFYRGFYLVLTPVHLTGGKLGISVSVFSEKMREKRLAFLKKFVDDLIAETDKLLNLEKQCSKPKQNSVFQLSKN